MTGSASHQLQAASTIFLQCMFDFWAEGNEATRSGYSLNRQDYYRKALYHAASDMLGRNDSKLMEIYGNLTSHSSVPLPTLWYVWLESAFKSPCCAGAVHPSGNVTNTFRCCLQRAWCNLLSIASALLLTIFVWCGGMKPCKADPMNPEESQGPNCRLPGGRGGWGESTKGRKGKGGGRKS